MILYQLRCQDGHGFEAWFRDGATYDAQAAAGDIACPVCAGTRIEKAPMAPRIAKRSSAGPAVATASETGDSPGGAQVLSGDSAIRAQLEQLQRHIEEKCEPVGDNFAEEARRIHYGEAPHRDIYGQATDAEAGELTEEGVEFLRIPWPARTDS